MIQFAAAKALIDAWLVKTGAHLDGGLALLEDRTIWKSYGWVFRYNSSRYLETGDLLRHGIAGNGPVVVLANTGEIIALGTALPVAEEIAEFERARGLRDTGMTGIEGREFDWLACDADNRLALFSTAGGGYAPREFVKDIEVHDSAIEEIEALPACTRAAFSPDLTPGLKNTWYLMANRGLFAFDSDPNGGPYKLVAAPVTPSRLSDLPEHLAAVIKRIRFQTMRFADHKVLTNAEVEQGLARGQYSADSIVRVPWPQWTRVDEHRHQRSWHFEMCQDLPEDELSLAQQDGIESHAARGLGSKSLVVTTVTTDNPLSDVVFFDAAVRMFKDVETRFGRIRTIESFYRRFWRGFYSG
jgi:hypothetical protein